MSDVALTGITVYPVKSAAGIQRGSWQVDGFGLRHDRRWMVVDLAGDSLTQRELPRLALLAVELRSSELVLRFPGAEPLELPLDPPVASRVRVTVLGEPTEAMPIGPAAATWLSRCLGVACRLVYMPDDVRRSVDPTYAGPTDRTSFTDGFPFLLISDASLAELNGRLPEPLPMNRFRPNLVVSGCEPFAEDGWDGFWIGSIEFNVVKPCARCVITTTDQVTAQRGKEPLRTLASFRARDGGVLFGQNVLHRGEGVLSVGTPLKWLG